MIGFIVRDSATFLHYFETLKKNLAVFAVIFSPLITLVIAERLRQGADREDQKYDVLKNLISYRHIKGSHRFLSSLNRVNLVFDNDNQIKELVRSLWRSYVNNETQQITSQKEVELIHKISQKMGFDISEFDIDNFFMAKSAQPISVIQNIQQSTTLGQGTHLPESKTGAIITTSNTSSIAASSITSVFIGHV